MKYQTLNFIRTASDSQLISLLLSIAESNADIVETAIDTTLNGEGVQVPKIESLMPMRVSPANLALLDMGEGKKVASIKLARELYGLGLKEAKDLVEWLEGAGHVRKFSNY